MDKSVNCLLSRVDLGELRGKMTGRSHVAVKLAIKQVKAERDELVDG